jgi:hypothetical protein
MAKIDSRFTILGYGNATDGNVCPPVSQVPQFFFYTLAPNKFVFNTQVLCDGFPKIHGKTFMLAFGRYDKRRKRADSDL